MHLHTLITVNCYPYTWYSGKDMDIESEETHCSQLQKWNNEQSLIVAYTETRQRGTCLSVKSRVFKDIKNKTQTAWIG